MTHGGARKGAGRPTGTGAFKEPTKAIRLPQSMIKTVLQFVENKGFQLPLYGAKVAAGIPSSTEDFIETHLDLNEHLVKHPSSTFLVKVTGDSMIEASIYENDLLVVDKSITPETGKIAVAAIDGQLTVKRLCKKNNVLYLIPENKKYKPIEIKEENSIHILGIVTHVLHAL